MNERPESPPQRRRESAVVRRAARVLALVPAVAVTFATSSAFATAPDTFPKAPHVSALHALLILLVIPASLFAVIALLVYVPSMSRAQSYSPGQPWRHEPEWFGGPRGGVQALDASERPALEPTDAGAPASGGASGRW